MSRKQDGYIRKEASEITQIPARTIQYYTDRGFVIPDVAAPTGRGTTRRYSLKNLVELALIKELTRHGLTLNRIDGVMREVRGGLERYWDQADDIAIQPKLTLIVIGPHASGMGVHLGPREEIDLAIARCIDAPSFLVISLDQLILRVLMAAIGDTKIEAFYKLKGDPDVLEALAGATDESESEEEEAAEVIKV